MLAHGLVLLVIGLHVPRTMWRLSSLDDRAIRVELSRQQVPPPRPALRTPPSTPLHAEPPKKRQEAAPAPTTAAAPVATPAPAPVQAPAAPAVPAPGRPSPWLVGPVGPPLLGQGFANSMRTRAGCSDPNAAGLSKPEREACKKRLAEGAADAPFIPAPIAPEKRAAYDRAIRCRQNYWNAGIPPGLQNGGLDPRQQKMHECPASDQ